MDGEIFQGKSKALCVPGFNCYSCPGAIGACPLGSLKNALAASGRHAGFYMYGILLLFGLTLGRTICGWICPLGLIQELLYKVPTYKLKKNRVTHALTYLKYVLLAVFVIAIPLWHGLREGMAVPGFCKYICPAGTLEGAVGLLSNPKNADYFAMLGPLFTRKFVIMLIIGTACVFIYRSFCRFLCPLGAIYGISLHALRRLCAHLSDGCASRRRSRVHSLRQMYKQMPAEGHFAEGRTDHTDGAGGFRKDSCRRDCGSGSGRGIARSGEKAQRDPVVRRSCRSGLCPDLV